MSQALDFLSQRFAMPGLSFESGAGGLTTVKVRTAIASGELYLQGAHVTAWQPNGHDPVLWLSRASNYEKGKPIRGGVPICLPWFGPNATDASAPAHGSARVIEWEFVKADETDDGGIAIQLQAFIAPFQVRFGVEFGRELKMTLETSLPSGHSGPEKFEDALHTYFAVGDIRHVSIWGLEDASYIDKMDNAQIKLASGSPIEFSDETDRVYFDTLATSMLVDHGRDRMITVGKSGSKSTVVWNPWINKSIRMPDFGDNEWPEMVCIETANVGKNAIDLSPGESHSTTAMISVVMID